MSEIRRVIGTHDGKFHADEVLGCYLLKQLCEYKDATIVRTRDPEKLNKCDVVIDVGGLYDYQKKRFDHHQRMFEDTLKSVTGDFDDDVKLSSAGLVYAHFGKEILKSMVKRNLSDKEMDSLYLHIYRQIIKEIDAKDNGIEPSDQTPRYRIHTDLSSRISRLNRYTVTKKLDQDELFTKALEMAGNEFTEVVEDAVESWLPARESTAEALKNRLAVDPSGKIIKFETSGIMWPIHLKVLEVEMNIYPGILFVVFPDLKQEWRVQGVSRDGGFSVRRRLLPNCAALRGDELVEACGIPDANFVHHTGFIGGARSCEGALQMAQKSICNPTGCDSDDSDDI